MKKLLLTIIFTFLLANTIFASDLSSQIKNARCVDEYGDNATVDDFDTVMFGSYPQNSAGVKEPIEWIVLDKQDDKALLVSKYILDRVEYNKTANNPNLTWNDSYIRKWLNTTFIDSAFSYEEKDKIISTYLENYQHEWVDTGVYYDEESEPYLIIGAPDNVKIFLLSFNDIDYYLYTESRRNTRCTNYSKPDGKSSYYMLRDIIDAKIFSADTDQYEKSRSASLVVSVSKNGKISEVLFGDGRKAGVRPAIWVEYDQIAEMETEIDTAVHENTIEETTMLETTTQETTTIETTMLETTVQETNIQETTIPEVINVIEPETAKETIVSDESIEIDYSLYDYDKPPKFDESQIVLSLNDIKSATGKEYKDDYNQTNYAVNLTLTNDGKQKLKEATERNIGNIIYVIYNDKIISYPTVQDVISDGKCQIFVLSNLEEAKDLAKKIKNKEGKLYFVEGELRYPLKSDSKNDTKEETIISDELSENESYHILSEKTLKSLESEAIFTATYNIRDLRWIKVNKEKDGFLGMFGNDIYYVNFEFKNWNDQEHLIGDYDLKHPTEEDTDIEDCLGNAIRRIPMSEWSSLKIKMYSKEAAENVVNFINDGNDYKIFFFDTLIESTGKLEADPNTALFDIEIPAKMISQTHPIQSRIPNSRLELNDLGFEIADGINVWVNIGDEAYYVQICTKDYDFNSEYQKKISDYYFGHRDTGFNVIDSLGHNIKIFYYGGFGNYYLYTDSMQDAKEISSYLNTSNAKYKLYFYDKVLESTGVHNDIDKSKAKFNVKFSKDMIEWAKPEKTREMKAVVDSIGGMEILGIPFGVSLGQDLYEVTVHLKKDFNPVTAAQVNYYDMGFMSTGQKIFDNYGHKIIRAYDESFDQFIIYADTYEEAEQISTELNDSNCDYTLYYFDNVIESTGRYKPDASKADLTIEILDKYNRYSTAHQDTQKQLSVGWDSIGIEDGGAIYYVSTHLSKNLDNSDNISKMKDAEIYDSLGHKILKMEFASGYDYDIYAESFTDAQEIASYMNMTDSVYKLYFYK